MEAIVIAVLEGDPPSWAKILNWMQKITIL